MSRKGMIFLLLCGMVLACVATGSESEAQLGAFSKDDLIKYTPEWKGERYPDGRPKVSDEVLEKLKDVVIDDAILVVKENGYLNQYEDGFVSNQDRPRLIGRAATAVFMPERPDVRDAILAHAAKNGQKGSGNMTVVNALIENDVVVADLYGKIENTFAGGGVSGRMAKMGVPGIVIDGGCLDEEEIVANLPDYTAYVRGWHPTHLNGVMLTSMNAPVRIGMATVMPGDVVMGGYNGVLFIPAHLAEAVADKYGK